MSTHNKPVSIKKEKSPLVIPESAGLGIFSSGLRHEFEPVMVNQPSVLEPLKFYCKCCLCRVS